MSSVCVSSGMNLRKALVLARRLGCQVVPVRGTDEIRISHPSWARTITVKGTRHSAPRILTTYLRKLERQDSTGFASNPSDRYRRRTP